MKRTFKKEIISLIIFSIIISVSIITFYNSYNMSKEYTNQFENNMISNANLTKEVIKTINNKYIENIENLIMDPNAQNIFNNSDSKAWFEKTLEGFLKTHKEVINVYYGLNNGVFIIKPYVQLEDFDPRKRPWYIDAIQNEGKVIVTDPYEDATQKGRYVITYAKAVKNAENGQVLGVIGIDVELTMIKNMVSNIKLGENGYVTIIDKKGNIIAHKDSNKLGKTYKDEIWVKDILNSKESKGENVIDNIKYMSYYNKDEVTGWNIAVFIPENEIKDKIKTNINGSIIIALIFILISIIPVTIFTKNITGPINNLVKALEKVKNGDFTQNIKINKKLNYEMKTITESINMLIESMLTILKNIINTSSSIKESSESLALIMEQSSAAGEEISKAILQISEGSQEQANNLQVSSEILDKLSSEVSVAVEYNELMNKSSNDVKVSTEEGKKVINILIENFQKVSESNKELADKINLLTESSNKISKITDAIKSITEQTSLLALNASIEAARAGEAGRGFSVVAEEVRKLSEESALSALEINDVIGEIKNDIIVLSNKIEETKNLNEEANKEIEITQLSFDKIEKSETTLEENINEVIRILDTINKSKNELIDKITTVVSIAQETAATTEEISASSQEQSAGLQEVVNSAEKLSNLAEQLDDIVKKFKVN